MYLLLIHRDLMAYKSRLAVVERLKTIVTLEHQEFWKAGPAQTADCIIVHEGQHEDHEEARTFIRREVLRTRLIVFGGAATEKRVDTFGYEVPEEKFRAQAYDFFKEWKRRGEFPGWEYLISRPEYFTCVAVLDRLSPASRGGEARECSQEWTRLREARDAFAPRNSVVEALWEEAKAAEIAVRRADSNALPAFTKLRRLLIGDAKTKIGIAQLLETARRNMPV